MTRYLITGASGLVGQALLPLLPEDAEVYTLGKACASSRSVVNIPIDLAHAWRQADLPARMDVIIHLAQSRKFRHFPQEAHDIFAVNAGSSLQLLDYARQAGVKRFILASPAGARQRSKTGDGEIGFYLTSKVCAELIAECYGTCFEVSILRFSFVYGPGQKHDMLIPRLVTSVIRGAPIRLHNESGIRLMPTYVADAAETVLRIAEAPHCDLHVNVGGPEALSLKEVGEMIGQAVGRPPRFDIQPQSGTGDLVFETRGLTTLLGRPLIAFPEGLRRLLTQDGSLRLDPAA